MKTLTTEQLIRVLKWSDACVPPGYELGIAIINLITAECCAHGYAGYEDAVKHLLEDKT